MKFVSIGGQTAAVTNISKTKISALKTRAFTGKPLTQALTITYGGKKLVNGRDYTLPGRIIKNIGTASVTIKEKENITVLLQKIPDHGSEKTVYNTVSIG